MTRIETIKLMAVIKTAYPEFSRDVDHDACVNLWQKMLDPYDYQLCEAALCKHIMTNKFAPKVSEIIDLVEEIDPHAKFGKPTLAEYAKNLRVIHQQFDKKLTPEQYRIAYGGNPPIDNERVKLC
jgi:hypothetical protein